MGLRHSASAALVAALSASTAAGQTVDRVHVLVDLTAGDGSASVTAEYRLRPAGATVVPLALLGIAGATADSVYVDRARHQHLTSSAGTMRHGSIPIDPRDESLRVEYRVASAYDLAGASLHGAVPLPTVAWPPTEAGPDLFDVTLWVPPGWTIAESFPSRMVDRSASEARRVYRADLSVMPAMVTFRGRTDGVWRPGLPLLLDVFAALLLVAFGGVGWLHLSRVAGRREDPAMGPST